MKIEFLGHSCFKFTDGRGNTILTDPYDASVGFDMKATSADAVTISHAHHDHNNLSKVTGFSAVYSEVGKYDFRGIKIEAISSFHDSAQGKKRGNNLIFKYNIDGVNIVHLGDIGEDYSSLFASKLQPVDVLLIPTGGYYTIDAAEAKRYVEGLKPKVVIPMHYLEEGCDMCISGVESFTKLFENAKFISCGETEVDRKNFSDSAEILVLRRK